MTRDEIVYLVQQRLGGATTLTERILIEMDSLQSSLELGEPKPWFLLQPFPLELSAYGYSILPSTFLREWDEMEASFWINGNTVPIVKDNYDVLRNKFGDTKGERPTHYDIVGDHIFFFPIPTTTIPATLWAYFRDIPASQSEENAWCREAPQLLANGTGRYLAQFAEQATAFQMFSTHFMEAARLLTTHNVARTEAQRVRILGGRP